MVYVFVEIVGFRQLSRLRPPSIEGVIESMTGLVRYSGGVCATRDRGIVLYAFDPAGRAETSVGDIVFQLYEILAERRAELSGFIVLADEFDDASYGVPLVRLSRVAYATDRLDSLWIGRRLRRRLERQLVMRPEGDSHEEFREVLGRSDESFGAARWTLELLERPTVVAAVVAAVQPYLRRQAEAGWIRVVGERWLGKTRSVDAALRTITKDPPLEWLRFSVPIAGLPRFRPFLEAIRHDFLAQVIDHLKPSERNVWVQRRNVLASTCADHLDEDLFSTLTQYVLAYARVMNRRRLPPIIVLEGFHLYHPEAYTFVAQLIRRFASFAPLVPICITESDAIPSALTELPRTDVRVEPLGVEEVRAALARAPAAVAADPEDLRERTGGVALFAFHYFALSNRTNQSGSEISAALAREIDQVGKVILSTCHRSAGILDRERISQFLSEQGIVPEIVRSSFARLEALGFITRTTTRVATAEIAEQFAQELSAERLDAKLAEFCYRLWSEGRSRATSTLVAFIARYGPAEQALELFFRFASRLLEQGEVDLVLEFLQREELFPVTSDPALHHRREFIIDVLALRASVLLQEREQSELRITRIKEAEPAGDLEIGESELAIAQHHYACQDFRWALDSAKRALLASQRTPAPLLEYRADIEIGLNMLAVARFEEAEDYFTIARGSAGGHDATFSLIRSLGYEAITLYLFGNVSKALRTAEAAHDAASAACRRDWQRLFVLLRGRCLFTLGAYDEAAKLFQSGTTFCRVYPHETAGRVFNAWAARAAAFGGAKRVLQVYEALGEGAELELFKGESRVEQGDWQAAISHFDRAIELCAAQAPRYQPSEVVPWSSGYAAIEDRALRTADGHGTLDHVARALRAYAKGRLGETDEAVSELTRLTREEKLSDHDPRLYLYYYLHSLVLPEGEGERLVDRLTALSKALKHVQEFATRIDEVKRRQSFLHMSTWNVRLLADARRFKLL